MKGKTQALRRFELNISIIFRINVSGVSVGHQSDKIQVNVVEKLVTGKWCGK